MEVTPVTPLLPVVVLPLGVTVDVPVVPVPVVVLVDVVPVLVEVLLEELELLCTPGVVMPGRGAKTALVLIPVFANAVERFRM
jgi:hypothetical protein